MELESPERSNGLAADSVAVDNFASSDSGSNLSHSSPPPPPPTHRELCGGKRGTRRVITWDEAVIAEHDKERGTRQKIDEAPTPFRYSSESDQSEGESSVSSTENSAKKQSKKKTVSLGGVFTAKFEHPADDYYLDRCVPVSTTFPAGPSQGGSVLTDGWSTLQAKLAYEQHLQEVKEKEQIMVDGETTETYADAGTPMEVDGDDSEYVDGGGYSDRSPLPGNRKVVIGSDSIPVPHTAHTEHTAALLAGTVFRPNRHQNHNSVHMQVDSEEGVLNGDEGQDGETPHSKDFASRRAAHYNEYLVLMAARKKFAEEDEEDQDDD